MSCSLEDEKWCCLCHDTRSLGQHQFCCHDDLIERPFMLLPYLHSLAQLFGEFISELAVKTRFTIQNWETVSPYQPLVCGKREFPLGSALGNAVLKFRIDLVSNDVRVKLVMP